MIKLGSYYKPKLLKSCKLKISDMLMKNRKNKFSRQMKNIKKKKHHMTFKQKIYSCQLSKQTKILKNRWTLQFSLNMILHNFLHNQTLQHLMWQVNQASTHLKSNKNSQLLIHKHQSRIWAHYNNSYQVSKLSIHQHLSSHLSQHQQNSKLNHSNSKKRLFNSRQKQ